MSSDPSLFGGQSEQDTERAGLQIDAYGIKGRLQPGDIEEANPRTWREVWQHVNKGLKALATELVDFPVETFRGARRLIKGVTSLPATLGNRIDGAHAKSDAAEEKRQFQLQNGTSPLPPVEDPVGNIREQLLYLRANGYSVQACQDGNGRWIIAIVRPEHSELALELGKNTAQYLDFEPEDKDSESPPASKDEEVPPDKPVA